MKFSSVITVALMPTSAAAFPMSPAQRDLEQFTGLDGLMKREPEPQKLKDLPISPSEENQPFIAAGTQQQASEKLGWNTRSSKRSRLCSAFVLLSAVLTLGALSSVLIVAQRREAGSLVPLWPTYQGGSRVVEHCGNSPEEAQALGCVWGLMSFGWIHPRCYNPEESQLWMDKHGPWKWYYDLNATAEIPDDELTSTRRVYTEQGYHVVHCLYIFKLLHLTGMSGHVVTDEAIPLATPSTAST